MIELIGKGIAFAAPVGPVTAEAIRRGLQGGFSPAFRVKMGAAVGDAILLIVVYYFVNAISNETIRSAISLIGACVIIYMGIKNIIKGITVKPDMSSSVSFENGMKLGLGLALTNPFAIAFWFGTFSNLSATDALSQDPLFGGFLILTGILLWDVILCLLLEIGKRYVNVLFIQIVTTSAGLVLCYFGVRYIYMALIAILDFNILTAITNLF
jgi:L-lysine exporter family protein LysE/ArgO